MNDQGWLWWLKPIPQETINALCGLSAEEERKQKDEECTFVNCDPGNRSRVPETPAAHHNDGTDEDHRAVV